MKTKIEIEIDEKELAKRSVVMVEVADYVETELKKKAKSESQKQTVAILESLIDSYFFVVAPVAEAFTKRRQA